MIKKDLLIPIALAGLGIIFSIILVAVFVSKGKSKFWVSKKMRIGAIIISLSSFSVQQSCVPVTCYEPVMPDQLYLVINKQGEVLMNLSDSTELRGILYERESIEFSFNIADTLKSDSIIQKGEILPVDGNFDESSEDFFLKIDANVVEGSYYLNLFNVGVLKQDSLYPMNIFRLKIIKD